MGPTCLTLEPWRLSGPCRCSTMEESCRWIPSPEKASGKVTGKRTWNGIDPVAMALSWVVEPERWSNEPIVEIGSSELAAELSLPPGTRYASFQQLASIPRLMELIRDARRASEIEEPLDAQMKAAQEIERRLVWLQQFTTRRTLRLIPDSSDPLANWSQPEHVESLADLEAIEKQLRSANLAGYPSQKAMQREITYNRVGPTRIAWIVLLIATIASLVAWVKPRPWLDWLAAGGLFAGFAVMTWGLAIRWQIAGRIPASDMYESMLFLAWGVGLFALVAMGSIRNRLVVLNAAMVSTLTMILVDLLPMDPFVHPMPPVLSGTPWLAIHVPITMVSYSSLPLAFCSLTCRSASRSFEQGSPGPRPENQPAPLLVHPRRLDPPWRPGSSRGPSGPRPPGAGTGGGIRRRSGR